RVGVERKSLPEESNRVVVASFVVELMGLFVEIVGAAECVRHRPGLPWTFGSIVGHSGGRIKRTACAGPSAAGQPNQRRDRCLATYPERGVDRPKSPHILLTRQLLESPGEPRNR